VTRPVLANRDARRLFLHRHALSEAAGPATGAALLDLIRRLGFVQVDSINTVARAHHMILHARRPAYRPAALDRLHRQGHVFEHWTHDASVIPTEFYPHWKLRFPRAEARIRERWPAWQGPDFAREADNVLAHVREKGPSGTSEIGEGEERSSGGWWEWNPSKTALEYLWHTGRLAIARREAFRKIYDLPERVIPEPHYSTLHEDGATIDWAANAALDRLGFATPGEIWHFFNKLTAAEAKAWSDQALRRGEVVEVEVEGADGTRRRALARPDVLAQASDAPEAPGIVRILSPFDPALRDRARAERLFGFHYRIEVFVPAPKRKWGYYVFPVLEGDRLIGRIDMKAERERGRLHVTAFWPEAGVRMGRGRLGKLDGALDRTRRLADVAAVTYADGWLRETLG
jgi:uncharacterized protein YcaQ